MVQKRPFDAEEILEVSFKHPKQVGPSNQLVSFSESVFPEAACHIPKTSVELPRGAVDFKTGFPGGISLPSWSPPNTSEEDVPSEPPVHLPFVPEYLSPERPIRTLVRYEDIYSILLEHPPHKLVSVGASHQADVPAWDSGATSGPNASDAVGDEVKERLMGTCIIPMPQMELSVFDNEEVGKGRTDCGCEDRGSTRCVRQHIVEAREKLMNTIGHERFTDLGLSDMGEQVADKWTAEEEQLFCEVVFNNPANLGKNFWNYLSIVFPSKTKKEIVSYYFNVFVLRRRAEQNRNNLLNIDSDDDEWQGGDGNEIATQEEDEDSIAESPVCEDDACLANCLENGHQDHDEYASDETCAVNGTADFTKRNIDDDSKYDPAVNPHSIGSPSHIHPQDQPVWQEIFDEEVQDDSCMLSNAGVASQETRVKIENGDQQDNDEYASDDICAVNGTADFTKKNIDDDSKYDPAVNPHSIGSLPLIQPQDQPVWLERFDEEAQDDSCTLSDAGVASQETQVKIENGDHWCGNYNGVCSVYSQGNVLDPCDAKVWDSGPVSKIDFLPTCSMIKEVFGDGRRQ